MKMTAVDMRKMQIEQMELLCSQARKNMNRFLRMKRYRMMLVPRGFFSLLMPLSKRFFFEYCWNEKQIRDVKNRIESRQQVNLYIMSDWREEMYLLWSGVKNMLIRAQNPMIGVKSQANTYSMMTLFLSTFFTMFLCKHVQVFITFENTIRSKSSPKINSTSARFLYK